MKNCSSPHMRGLPLQLSEQLWNRNSWSTNGVKELKYQVLWALSEMIGIASRQASPPEKSKYFLKGYYRRNTNLGSVRNTKGREVYLPISLQEFILAQNISQHKTSKT